MNKTKEFWCDVETTGLSPHKNFVHQIAIIIVIDGEVKEEVHYKVKPPKGTIINKHALAVSNTTMDMLNSYPDHSEVYKDMIKLLSKYIDKYDKTDKFSFFGYNCHFDVGFIRGLFLANADNYYGSWIWSNNIDIMVLAGQKLKEERKKMKNFKLGTVAEYLDVKPEGVGLHDGMTDIKLTRGIYKKLTID